jgi:hypothetical protein
VHALSFLASSPPDGGLVLCTSQPPDPSWLEMMDVHARIGDRIRENPRKHLEELMG